MKSITTYTIGLAAAVLVGLTAVPGYSAFQSHRQWPALSASATTGGSPVVDITNVSIRNISNNATVGALSWTNATPGSGFLVADQYIQVVSNINRLNGGIQIYTDNRDAAANPQYTGIISSNTATPAGLVMVGDTTQKLATAWRASTYTLTGVTGSDPNNTADPNSFLWFYHEDKQQVAVPVSSAAVFGNGDPYITFYAAPGTPLLSRANNQTYLTTTANSGVHFAQSPTQFGGFKSGSATTYIYTEADFTGALAGQTYSTNRLFIEAFSL